MGSAPKHPRINSFLALLVIFLAHWHNKCTASKVSGLDTAITFAPQNCPCSNPEWCKPITDVSRKEVFAFSIRNDESHWNLFDWSKLTTVVMFGYLNDTLMCLAHSHNVRVVMLGNVDEETFTDPTKRERWILQQMITAKNHFMDGLNFDFESAVPADNKKVRDAYTALVKETNQHFKKELPYSQISVDVAWKPNIDVRYYDYQGLAEGADLLFVMAYDEQSQIFGECVAGPNSPVGRAKEGLSAYLNGYNHTIKPDKLVLGVPWYGYVYTCIHTEGAKCYINEVPFRGVNCSDAAGKQYDYSVIYTLIDSMPKAYKWNESSSTPYLMFPDTGKNISYQIQFDDPRSLKIKYDFAAKLGLRGVGMWNIDSLDYTQTESGAMVRDSMFKILPSRKVSKTSSGHRVDKTAQETKKTCPCSNPKWCDPITDIPKKEVFAFSGSNASHWQKYDWSKITTLCPSGPVNVSLVCLAHSHNVRVVHRVSVTAGMFLHPELRAKWIAYQLKATQNNFLDGINFDYEHEVRAKQKFISEAYADLVNETAIAFKKAAPSYQISVDASVIAHVSYRAYDYPRLAAASDFLFVMAYDESGFGHSGPNSALGKAKYGIGTYNKEGIGPDKLVLGVPWYGYEYQCATLVQDTCSLNKTSKVGQVSYSSIYYLLMTMPDKYKWNYQSQTPFFSYTDSASGKTYQVQYDNPKSLKLKYDLAAEMGLRGVGMWTIDTLDYSDSERAKEMREPMFAALPSRNASFKPSPLKFESERHNILSDSSGKFEIQKKIVPETVSAPESAKCPCSDPKLCEPIKDTTRKEVFAFSIVNDENHWQKFDWSKITTLCMFNYVNESLMCLAHSHNVRVVTQSKVLVFSMTTPELRKEWIDKQLKTVKDNFLDGFNFDVEMGISPQQKGLRDAYTALVTETNVAFKKELPYSQISVDVIHDANSVACAYDYPKLAAASDFLFIMAYDEYGYSRIGPNADFPITNNSIYSYFEKGIGPDRLVLGLPWYGYIYNCVELEGNKCFLNSSMGPHEHQSEQYSYSNILTIMHTTPGTYGWNTSSLSPYFSYVDPKTQKAHQIQYDDPKSLKLKYDLAAQRNLRGVGMWTIDFLDFSDTGAGQQMRQSMFDPLPPRPTLPIPPRSTLPTSHFKSSNNARANTRRVQVDCPCSDPKLCEPIKDTPRKEVFAFSIVNDENHWQKFDWSKITTVCMFNYINVSLMCLAHSHNVRAVMLGAVNETIFSSPTLRTAWVAQQVQIAKDNFLDGINFDFEGTITQQQVTLRDDYFALINATTQAFKQYLPSSQISVDVIFSPNAADRYYGYTSLAQIVDFLMIMAYDESAFISGSFVAGPNSGYLETQMGINNYLHVTNISGEKLVLGLPWYGKIYECMSLVQDLCVLNGNEVSVTPYKIMVPGVKAGVEYIFYDAITDLLMKMPRSYHWNETSSTPFMVYEDSTTHKLTQIQFDNPRSLKMKTDLVSSMGLRGVGIWTVDYVDYSDTASAAVMRKSMFGTLPMRAPAYP